MTDYLETADSNETIFLATFLVTFLTRDMVNTGKVKGSIGDEGEDFLNVALSPNQ